MARKPTIADLVEKHLPAIRDAFLAAIQEISSKARLSDITRALERGDVQGAIDALYIDRAAFRVFENAIAEAYQDGGVSTTNGLPVISNPEGGRFLIRFDSRNLRAEQWLREHSSNLVTRIVEDQKLAVREALTDGMIAGENPRNVALGITGRMNRATGRREGGIVGLSSPQEAALRRAREELREGRYGDFLQRKRHDKRFDRTLSKAERDGRKLTTEEITRIINRYSDSLLKLRGETIGRTEALVSLHAAQHESLRQLVDSGKVSANQVRRIWDATGDMRTRPSHTLADGQSVGLDENFTVNGRFMAYPGDPAGGAAETVNCRCYCRVRIDFLSNIS